MPVQDTTPLNPSTPSLRARRPEREQQIDQVEDVDAEIVVHVGRARRGDDLHGAALIHHITWPYRRSRTARTDFSLPLLEAARDRRLVDSVRLVPLVIGEAMVGQFVLPD